MHSRVAKNIVRDIDEGKSDDWIKDQYPITDLELESFYNRMVKTDQMTLSQLDPGDSNSVRASDSNSIRRKVYVRLRDKIVGLQDVPVQNISADTLEIMRFAKAISSFIKERPTPMAISIQGDWGSGKSTLMKLIKAELLPRTSSLSNDKDNNGQLGKLENKEESELKQTYTCIEFNCWEHSQFHAADNIPVFLMVHFIKALEKEYADISGSEIEQQLTKEAIKQRLSLFSRVTSFTWEFTKIAAGELIQAKIGIDPISAASRAMKASSQNLSELVEADSQSTYSNYSASGSSDFLDILNEVKLGLRNIVIDHVGTFGRDKIVIFIDDLDRLEPERTIELLEAMKTFLDLEYCVFVVACDYDVIREGLAQKYPGGSITQTGKSFLDKVFQLSFQMPTGIHNIEKYIKQLLTEAYLMTEDYATDDLRAYISLLEHSVGFNPRNIKRLINNLSVTNYIQEKVFTEKPSSQSVKREAIVRQQIFFGIGCMEATFNKAYQMMLSISISRVALVEFLMKHLSDKNWILQQGLVSDGSVSGIIEREEMEVRAEKLALFNEELVRIIDKNPDRILDESEIAPVQQALNMMRPNPISDPKEKERMVQNRFFAEFLDTVFKDARNRLGQMCPDCKDADIKGGKTGIKQYRRYWFNPQSVKAAWSYTSLFYRLSYDRSKTGVIILSLEGDMKYIEDHGIGAEAVMAKLKEWAESADHDYEYSEFGEKKFAIKKQFSDIFITRNTDYQVRSIEEFVLSLIDLLKFSADLFDKKEVAHPTQPKAKTTKLTKEKALSIANDIRGKVSDTEIMKNHSIESEYMLGKIKTRLLESGLLNEKDITSG